MMDIKLFDDLKEAVFVDRPNRFCIKAALDGKTVTAHLPNPGRLKELLFPGCPLWLAAEDRATRKTAFTAVGVRKEDLPVFLHTARTNDVIGALLEADAIPALRGWRVARREVTVDRHRFDFLLVRGKQRYFLEVKACTLFHEAGAYFPDAPTERGRHHLELLSDLSTSGNRCGVLFAVFNGAARFFLPEWHTDPAFAETLHAVKEKVDVMPMALTVNPDFSVKPQARRVPIRWRRMLPHLADAGSYALVMKLPRKKKIIVGQLGEMFFSRGYYVYVGSALRNLNARMARHKRKRKKYHWHIDYLRQAASVVAMYPIRRRERLECRLAAAVRQSAGSTVDGFGASDCACESHLFYYPDPPEDKPAFIRAIYDARFGGL